MCIDTYCKSSTAEHILSSRTNREDQRKIKFSLQVVLEHLVVSEVHTQQVKVDNLLKWEPQSRVAVTSSATRPGGRSVCVGQPGRRADGT